MPERLGEGAKESHHPLKAGCHGPVLLVLQGDFSFRRCSPFPLLRTMALELVAVTVA